jgi:hypothetical protein
MSEAAQRKKPCQAMMIISVVSAGMNIRKIIFKISRSKVKQKQSATDVLTPFMDYCNYPIIVSCEINGEENSDNN